MANRNYPLRSPLLMPDGLRVGIMNRKGWINMAVLVDDNDLDEFTFLPVHPIPDKATANHVTDACWLGETHFRGGSCCDWSLELDETTALSYRPRE